MVMSLATSAFSASSHDADYGLMEQVHFGREECIQMKFPWEIISAKEQLVVPHLGLTVLTKHAVVVTYVRTYCNVT